MFAICGTGPRNMIGTKKVADRCVSSGIGWVYGYCLGSRSIRPPRIDVFSYNVDSDLICYWFLKRYCQLSGSSMEKISKGNSQSR